MSSATSAMTSSPSRIGAQPCRTISSRPRA